MDNFDVSSALLCRACEKFVYHEKFEEHSEICLKIQRARVNLASNQEEISRLKESIQQKLDWVYENAQALEEDEGKGSAELLKSTLNTFLGAIDDCECQINQGLNYDCKWKCPELKDTSFQSIGIHLERILHEIYADLKSLINFVPLIEELTIPDDQAKLYEEFHSNPKLDSDCNDCENSPLKYISGVDKMKKSEIVSKAKHSSHYSSPSCVRSNVFGKSRSDSMSKQTPPRLGSPLSRNRTFSSLSIGSMASHGLDLSIRDFAIVKPISKGAFGSVFLAKKKNTGDYYAIKVLKKTDMVAKNQITNIKAERKILSSIDSPFVVKLCYSFQSKNHLFLVLEYLNGGDCSALIQSVGYLDEKCAKQYVAEIVLALEYLHAQGIVHRDLKPDNILISSTGHLKLTDL